jgi:hypothetical protein
MSSFLRNENAYEHSKQDVLNFSDQSDALSLVAIVERQIAE